MVRRWSKCCPSLLMTTGNADKFLNAASTSRLNGTAFSVKLYLHFGAPYATPTRIKDLLALSEISITQSEHCGRERQREIESQWWLAFSSALLFIAELDAYCLPSFVGSNLWWCVLGLWGAIGSWLACWNQRPGFTSQAKNSCSTDAA